MLINAVAFGYEKPYLYVFVLLQKQVFIFLCNILVKFLFFLNKNK